MKRIILFILVFCLVIAAFACARGDSTPTNAFEGSDDAVDVKLSEFKDPEPGSVINIAGWGNVPVNQLIVVFEEGIDKVAAGNVIKQIGGSIVGELEIINLYQIETDCKTEAELTAAMDAAAGMEGVELVFPNEELYGKDITGTYCSPLKDPVYGADGNADHYNMIGMENAWKVITGSGVPLSKVNVGVLDDAIYTGSDEFGGEVKISGDQTDEPDTDKNGSIVNSGLNHGTLVTHVIGANAENSGMVGIASVLEDNLNISVKNLYDGKERIASNWSETAKTEEDIDITQFLGWGGKATYTVKALVYLKKQVDDGATVINCSYGPEYPDDIHSSVSKAYEKFFKAIQKTKPNVIFVAAAGNEGNIEKTKGALNGKNYYPAGLKLPNVITVGALNNDGSRAKFSNFATGDAEVTLSAPGVDMMLGVDENGKPIKASGTSFSAPQMTSAIALIQSINPELNAAQIKDLLVSTAAPGVTTGDQSIPIPEGMGAGVLKVDEAVLKTINDMREKQNLAPYSTQQLLDMNAVALNAKGSAQNFTVTAGIPAALGSSADVKIQVDGQHALSGDATQTVPVGGEASWDITLEDDSVFIRVKRLDNSGCASMTLIKEAGVSGVYDASGTATMWGTADPIKDFQARVEQDGTAMTITLANDTNTVLTGTYDDATKTFVGRDTRQSDDPFASAWWQWGDTTIVFDTIVSPITAAGRLYVPGAEDDLINSEIIVDFTMTKAAEQ